MRETFASHPDEVMVFRYTASKKGALSGKIQLSSAQGAASVAENSVQKFSGEMSNKLKYAAEVKVVSKGGKITANGDALVFENCSSLILYVDARTNYKPDYNSGSRGGDPLPANILADGLSAPVKIFLEETDGSGTFRQVPGMRNMFMSTGLLHETTSI